MNEKKFRFETLLRLRESVRDQKKNELAFLRKQRDDLYQSQKEMDRSIAEVQRKRVDTQKEGLLDITEQLHLSNRFDWLLEEKEKILSQLAIMEQRIGKAQNELEEAMQDVKIMENLREKDEEKEEEHQRRSQENQMDELQLSKVS